MSPAHSIRSTASVLSPGVGRSPVATPASKEKWIGCLVGQCIGDAVGAPVEGLPPKDCKRHAEKVLRQGLLDDTFLGQSRFGQYTDDSQLARELLLGLTEHGQLDVADYAARITRLFMSGEVVGAGKATAEVARRLASGVAPDEAGIAAPSAGNGSAMRAAPIGLWYADDPSALIAAAREQSRITHQDVRCAAGAVAVAGAVALSLRGRPIVTEPFLAELSEWVRCIDQTVAFDVYQISSWVTLSPDAAVTFMARAGLCPGFDGEWAGISGYVVPSVLWSLYSFLRSPDDFVQTIETAVAVGGDVDTTAAMAGAMSGAYLSVSALPQSLCERLTDQGRWGFADLTALAERAHAAWQDRRSQ